MIDAPPGVARQLPADYWKQWVASAISNLGDGINFVAMPLLALTLTDDERLLSLTVFATFVPWVVLALPIGVAVDRFDRRRLMIVSNTVRVGLFVAIGVAAANEHLGIVTLIGLLVLIGTCEVAFDSSAQALLPLIVDTEQLARANGLLFAAEIVAGSIAGLAVGALLFDISVSLPFHVNAATFVVAAGLVAWIRVTHRPATPTGPVLDGRLRSGFRWLLDHELLRTLALMFALTNLGLMFGQGIFVKYAIDELGLGPLGFGLLLAITSLGAASGGLLGHRVIERFGLRWSVLVPYLVFGVAQIVIGVVSQAWMVAFVGFLLGGSITIWNVVTVTIRQREIPADRFGRVNSVYRWLGASASATGVAAGGFVAYLTNLRAPFLMGGAITLLAAILFGRSVSNALGTPAPSPG